MTIQGPGSIRRGQMVDPDRETREREQKKRHFGRTWGKATGSLPVAPVGPSKESKDEEAPKERFGDLVLQEMTSTLFAHLMTLEELVGQLCFFEIVANYDEKQEESFIDAVQRFSTGGLIFTGGEPYRQDYLVQHYQSLAKVPLLIGASLSHAQGSPESPHDVERGRELMRSHRERGVHLLLKDEGTSGRQFQEISKGILEENGLSAELGEREERAAIPQTILEGSPSHRTLHLLDCRQGLFLGKEELLQLLRGKSDGIFLKTQDPLTVIEQITRALRHFKLSEEMLRQRVLRILTLKVLHINFKI